MLQNIVRSLKRSNKALLDKCVVPTTNFARPCDDFQENYATLV